tara:strand:- start:10150 stop:10407 length:258 start_codon:yes stop_codon:yes gene_type:complete
MRGKHQDDVTLVVDAGVYMVMKHYSLSLRDIDSLSMDEFGQMFSWAVAAKKIEAEEMDKAVDGAKSGARVAGTDVGGPMPHSEGW